MVADTFRNTDLMLGKRVDLGDGRGAFLPGLIASGLSYQLASNQSVGATSGTTRSSAIEGGSYLWDVQFTGTSITLQALGSDGVTWRDVATRTTSGTTGVVIGQDAVVRLYNPNGSGLTGVYSSLS